MLSHASKIEQTKISKNLKEFLMAVLSLLTQCTLYKNFNNIYQKMNVYFHSHNSHLRNFNTFKNIFRDHLSPMNVIDYFTFMLQFMNLVFPMYPMNYSISYIYSFE